MIENAIKYSEKSPEIEILLEEHPNEIEISISDNGSGIPSVYQNKVFDKFFRVPKGNNHNVKGHGLGLSYVKESVEKQGGSIELKSELGKGSTFTVKMQKEKNF